MYCHHPKNVLRCRESWIIMLSTAHCKYIYNINANIFTTSALIHFWSSIHKICKYALNFKYNATKAIKIKWYSYRRAISRLDVENQVLDESDFVQCIDYGQPCIKLHNFIRIDIIISLMINNPYIIKLTFKSKINVIFFSFNLHECLQPKVYIG